MVQIDELSPVRIREIWPNEPNDFTPWLAKNAELLGRALGLDLEHEATEREVGKYSADLVFREQTEDKQVVVENMYGITNHDHLGKVITYAAGLGTPYVVLLAEDFEEEHRSALNWLNSISSDEFRFFGVSIDVWRIGDSQPAPQLRVVVQPDDWQRAVRRSATELRPAERAYLRFWDQFLPAFQEAHPGWRRSTARRTSSSIGFPAPSPGWYRGGFYRRSDGRYGVGAMLTFTTGDVTKANETYDALAHERRGEIEDALGEELEWEQSASTRRPKISLYFPDEIRISDEERWPEVQAWLIDTLGKLRKVFDPLLDELRG